MANVENLNQLFQVKGKCPVSGCGRMLIPMEMLAHLLMYHATEEAAMHDVFAGDVSMYGIDLQQMQPGENHCIAKLSFVHRSDYDKEPSQRQICKQMPIMMMLYVTTWASLIASKFVEEHIIPPSRSPDQIDNMKVYLIYLISCSTSRRATADILALDANRKRVCYGARVIRNYADSPLVATHLEPFGCDFLYFTAADVAYLNEGPTEQTMEAEQTEPTMKPKQLLLRLVMRGEPDLF
ncbi:uncharacterized protein Dwil_GK10345 [Drosophila willistoni]|uniref:DUF4729 domain-containing protein n=1 Tax=Drosophila willistoni TaxID=7260 RepID=B4MJ81_DROWI|nr:uncharacterized protein LOC6638032 [Drosophila willistoni]EDW72170.1 uncharacterized protein Dwil_GK10345 [Drosophila willistoni]